MGRHFGARLSRRFEGKPACGIWCCMKTARIEWLLGAFRITHELPFWLRCVERVELGAVEIEMTETPVGDVFVLVEPCEKPAPPLTRQVQVGRDNDSPKLLVRMCDFNQVTEERTPVDASFVLQMRERSELPYNQDADEDDSADDDEGALPVPPRAAVDPASREVLRCWLSDEGFEVMVRCLEFEDPGVWGVALVDVARNIADAAGQDKRQQVLDDIKRVFDAEWDSPTELPRPSLDS